MKGIFWRALPAALSLSLVACGAGHRVEEIRDRRSSPGFSPLAVSVDLPSGSLEISRGDPQLLYEMRFRYCRDHFRARTVFDSVLNSLILAAEPLGSTGARRRAEPNAISLGLRTGVPLNLQVAVGEGGMDLDLTALGVARLEGRGGTGGSRVRFQAGNPRDLELLRFTAGDGPVRLEGLGWGRVTHLEFHGGAGEALVDWSGIGPGDASAVVDSGAGPLRLVFPPDLAVKVSGELAALGAIPAGFRRQGEGWVSENMGRAGRRLELAVRQSRSAIEFRWMR